MNPFDFNNNGELDAFDMMILDDIVSDDKNDDSSYDEEDEDE